MNNQIICDRYAQALLELGVEKNSADDYYKDLLIIRRYFSNNDMLRKAFYAPSVSPTAKRNIINKIFTNNVHKEVLNLILLLIEKNREAFLEGIIDSYWQKVNKHNKITSATLKVADDLPPTIMDDIRTQIAIITRSSVDMKVQIDPDLIGGFQIYVNDSIYDFSIKGQLDKAIKYLS